MVLSETNNLADCYKKEANVANEIAVIANITTSIRRENNMKEIIILSDDNVLEIIRINERTQYKINSLKENQSQEVVFLTRSLSVEMVIENIK